MTTKHFKLTADATDTVAASRDVSRAFMNIARAAQSVNREALKFRAIAPILREITHQAHITRLAFDRLANKTWVNAMKMRYALSELKKEFPDVPVVHGGGGGGYDPNSPRHRPLFGVAGAGLEQGQAVQNAIMAMLPALIPAIIFAAGKYFNIQEDVSSIKLANALKRAGIGGQTGGFRREADRLSDYTGRSQEDIEALLGELAISGIRDAKRAASFANLALGIEDAGGSSTNFAKALKGTPEEVAEKLNALSEELGINIPKQATVNQMLQALSDNLGGLAHEVNNAKEGFPELWNTIKENLSILGNEGVTGKVVEGATALIGGEPGKAGYMGTSMINDAIDKIPWWLSIASPATGFTKMTNAITNKPMANVLGGFADRKLDSRLDAQLRLGKISKEDYDKQVTRYYDSLKRGDYGAVYDQAYNPDDASRVGPSAPVQIDGPKGSGVVKEKKKRGDKIQRPDDVVSNKLRIEISGNPFQPSVFNGNASVKLK